MARRNWHLIRGCAAFALFLAGPASAQLAASVGLDSDYRLRGYSLTDDHPALTGQISYDHPSGAYFNLSALTEIGADTRFLGVIGAAGYAKRLGDRLTLDGGVLRYQIRAASADSSSFKYTEVYAGAYVGAVSGRLSYSPDYRTSGLSTLYAQIEAGFAPAAKWHVDGHLGLLTYLSSEYVYRAGDTHGDWRASVSRRFGRLELHSALSGGGPSSYYGYRVHKKVALTVGGSVSF